MNTIFENVTLIISVLGALTSAIAMFYSMRAFSKKKDKVISKIEEHELEEVLETDDLKKLGLYLEDSLSEVTVSQYSNSTEVENRFNTYLERIKKFVGTREEIEKDEIPDEPEPSEHRVDFYNEFPNLMPDYEKVITELREGESWNALARLRRNIEIKLKEIAESNGLIKGKETSLRNALNLLRKNELISESTARHLNFSTSVSNKAVHGIDIEPEMAEEAIFHAFIALSELENNT